MILNRFLILSFITAVAGGFLLGVTRDLPPVTPLLSWATQMLDVLKIIVALGGLAFIIYRLTHMGRIPSTRLPGDSSPLPLFMRVGALWLVGFSAGIGVQLLT